MTSQRVKTNNHISLINYDIFCEGDSLSNRKNNTNQLPKNVRALVVGPSNSGKTNALLILLFDPFGLIFENVYVFSKSLHQPKYKFLANILSSLSHMKYFPYDENVDVPHPNNVQENSVIIFDDISAEKQNNVRNYFAMGRHKKIDIFYLSQTYTAIPKHLIRDNANFLIVFKMDELNLKHIYSDHVNSDMPWETFKTLCNEAWSGGKNDFLVIDREQEMNNGRYRKNFNFPLYF